MMMAVDAVMRELEKKGSEKTPQDLRATGNGHGQDVWS